MGSLKLRSDELAYDIWSSVLAQAYWQPPPARIAGSYPDSRLPGLFPPGPCLRGLRGSSDAVDRGRREERSLPHRHMQLSVTSLSHPRLPASTPSGRDVAADGGRTQCDPPSSRLGEPIFPVHPLSREPSSQIPGSIPFLVELEARTFLACASLPAPVHFLPTY